MQLWLVSASGLWLVLASASAAPSPPCSVQLKDGQNRDRVAYQFFDCTHEMPEGEATFATRTGLGSPTGGDSCWWHRIPLRDLDPDVVSGATDISILAVVRGGACGGQKALGFTAGEATATILCAVRSRLCTGRSS